MKFPTILRSDETTRAGRMLAAGDVRVTVTNLESDEHITVRFKAVFDNRHSGASRHSRPLPNEDRNWVRVPLEEATHVFLEVPNANGDYPDKIGTFYPRTGAFFEASSADPERVRAAVHAALWLKGQAYSLLCIYRFQEESYCGVCGRTLTDPESIDLGIGPECNRQQTSSRHQHKQAAEHYSQQLSLIKDKAVRQILELCTELEDYQIDHLRRELDMWRSQQR